jgi:hypothetical protein
MVCSPSLSSKPSPAFASSSAPSSWLRLATLIVRMHCATASGSGTAESSSMPSLPSSALEPASGASSVAGFAVLPAS